MQVYIWGRGYHADCVITYGLNADVAGFIESKPSDGAKGHAFAPNEVKEYDAVIVASRAADAIYMTAKEEKMDLSKFIFMNWCNYIAPRENLELKKRILGEANYQRYLNEYRLYDESFFVEDKKKYIALNKRKEFEIVDSNDWPILADKYQPMGAVHTYFWQDLWAAKLIYRNRPKSHYDIGSRLDGFIAHILAMDIPIKVIDVRPFPTEISGLETVVADATKMEGIEDDSIESLSALCSLEHFGLGRYGDEVNPEACFMCFEQIQRKLKPGGDCYISVPIGQNQVQFNAHRIFRAETIVKCFSGLKLIEFSCTIGCTFERNVDIHKYDGYCEKEAVYGLFWLKKENR